MIVEQRTYDYRPGMIPQFLELYETSGARELQQRILGNLVGYYVTELGPINQTVHMWAYASLDDRTARRAKLGAEDVWKGFIAKHSPMLLRQDSKILLPTGFSPKPGHVGDS